MEDHQPLAARIDEDACSKICACLLGAALRPSVSLLNAGNPRDRSTHPYGGVVHRHRKAIERSPEALIIGLDRIPSFVGHRPSWWRNIYVVCGSGPNLLHG